MSFLDKDGLRYFWQGIKNKFYNKSEIDSQREELQKGIDDASKTGGVEVGTIVHIEDDAPVPEGYVEVTDPNEIVDISDTGITLNSGFSKTNGFQLYKQGKRIFGYLNIAKSSNFAQAETDVVVGKLTYAPKKEIALGISTTQSIWLPSTQANGYLYIGAGDTAITVKVNSVSDKTIRTYVEYVTN